MRNHITLHRLCLVTMIGLLASASAALPIHDFTSWTLAEDPPNALFDGSSSTTNAVLTAGDGTIPAGTDIGFSSIDGTTVQGSTSGNYFSAAQSFSLAIDYNLALNMPVGFVTSGIFIGFGIGEDATGINSAGIVLGAVNLSSSSLLQLAATGRVNDLTLPVGSVGGTASLEGTFFVSYDQATGDITVGAADSLNAGSPTGAYTFTGIANDWNGDDLLASFFMRSDDPSGAPLWTGTSASAVFSNLRVLEGSVTAIPEPSTAVLLSIFALGITFRRRVSKQ